MTLKKIYEEQLNYVKAIVEDIKRNGCSKDVIKYASNYAQVENADTLFWRVNYGEVYAYIDVDGDNKPTHRDIYFNMDEAGCYEMKYEALMREIDAKTEEEWDETDFGWCYDDVIAKGEYHLEYKTFEN